MIDSVSQYLSEIRGFHKLSAKEEKNLAARIRKKDPSARKELIEANLCLVIHIAKIYYSHARNLGSGVVSLDELIQEGNRGLVRAAETYNPKLSRFSTYAYRGISLFIKRFLDIRKMQLRFHKSFDMETLDAIFPDDKEAEHAQRMIENEDNRNRVEKLLRFLNPRERLVITFHFGLRDRQSRRLEDTADKFGVSRERIHQIICRACERLRAASRKVAYA